MRTLADKLNDRLLRCLHEANNLHAEVVKRGDGFNAEELARKDKLLEEAKDLRLQIDAERQLRDLAEQRESAGEVTLRVNHAIEGQQRLGDEGAAPSDPSDFLRRLANAPRQLVDGRLEASRELPMKQVVREARMRAAGADAKQIARSRERWIERLLTTSTSDTSAAGVTIQTDLATMIYQNMTINGGVMRAGPRVITTATGAPLNLSRLKSRYKDGNSASAAATAEGAAAGSTEGVFDRLALNPSKYTGRYDATREILEDNDVDLAGFVAEDIGDTIGWKTETAYTAAWIAGVSLANAVLITGAGSAAGDNAKVAIADSEGLPFALPQAYLSRPPMLRWMMHPNGYKAFLGLRDNNGQPYYRRGSSSFVEARPDEMEGSRVIMNSLCPDPSTPANVKNKPFVWLADPRDYFVVRIVGGIRIRVSTEAAFADDETVFIGDIRVGSAVLHASAGAALKGKNN